MNIKPTHFIQGALAFVAGGAILVAQAYPQYATIGHLIAGLCGVALANLGLLSDSAVTPPGTTSTVAASSTTVVAEVKP